MTGDTKFWQVLQLVGPTDALDSLACKGVQAAAAWWPMARCSRHHQAWIQAVVWLDRSNARSSCPIIIRWVQGNKGMAVAENRYYSRTGKDATRPYLGNYHLCYYGSLCSVVTPALNIIMEESPSTASKYVLIFFQEAAKVLQRPCQ